MANEDYKNGKLAEIVREFNHEQGTTKYEINGITQSIAVPFWREEEGKFKVIPKGSYRFINESGNNYLEITDETILQQVSQFQIVYVYSQISSKYVEDFPELSVLTTKYNELVEDTTKLFNYLKSTGMIADTLQMTKVLSQLEPLTTWYMDEQGEIRTLPISDLYGKFQQMIDTLYQEIKTLLMVDYNDMSSKLTQQTTASLKQLADRTVELKDDLQTFADGLERDKKALLEDYVEKTSKKTIDNHVETVSKTEINKYVESTTKPSIDNYVDTVSKIEIDNYVDTVSKPEIDNYVETVSKIDINNHTNTKKTEITTHTNNEIKRVTAEGEKQLEIIVGAGGGLATRVETLENEVQEIDTKFKNLSLVPVPVGGVLAMYNNTNPAELYSGTTWELVTSDKYIRTGNTALQTGGSNSISIGKENLPNIKLQVESFQLGRGTQEITGALNLVLIVLFLKVIFICLLLVELNLDKELIEILIELHSKPLVLGLECPLRQIHIQKSLEVVQLYLYTPPILL